MLGIGGGGDVVGALAVGAPLRVASGAEFVLGGVAWERFAGRPLPRARARSTQITGGRPLGAAAVLADR